MVEYRVGVEKLACDEKFVCDRMLKRLAKWLRLSGYDTLCDESFPPASSKEDTYLVLNFPDRILLTRDRELYNRRIEANMPAILIKSNSVEGQMKELAKFGVKFYPVMKRCTLCNTPLRRAKEEEIKEVAERENLGEHILKKELWYCEKCRKLYWTGGHWKNMLRFLRKIGLIDEE